MLTVFVLGVLLLACAATAKKQKPTVEQRLEFLKNSVVQAVESDEKRRAQGIHINNGAVQLRFSCASGDSRKLHNELKSAGLSDETVHKNAITGFFPIDKIPDLVNCQFLIDARPSRSFTRSGSVVSEAFDAHRVKEAFESLSVTGKGVTIGVISDSYNTCGENCVTTAEDGVASGDLPQNITILSEFPNGSDEGRAMIELIFDLAPDANYMFASGFNGYEDMAQQIRNLRAEGCDVIVDDIGYFIFPQYDELLSLAVDEVVADGAVYLTACGNSRGNTYSYDVEANGGFDDAGQHLIDLVIAPFSGLFAFVMYDDFMEPVHGKAPLSDVDVFPSDFSVGAASFFFNPTVPYEEFSVNNLGNPQPLHLQIVVDIFSSTVDPPFEPKTLRFFFPPPSNGIISIGRQSPIEASFNGGEIFGQGNAAGAISVAAVDAAFTPAFGVSPPGPIEDYSSRGGDLIRRDTTGEYLAEPELRLKPDLTGVDNTLTTFFFEQNDEFRFSGTSAAAPHVAAIAALMLEVHPEMTPEEVRSVLTDTAIDMDDPLTVQFDTGFDFITGYGLADASAAVLVAQEMFNRSRPLVEPERDENGFGLTTNPANDEPALFVNGVLVEQGAIVQPTFAVVLEEASQKRHMIVHQTVVVQEEEKAANKDFVAGIRTVPNGATLNNLKLMVEVRKGDGTINIDVERTCGTTDPVCTATPIGDKKVLFVWSSVTGDADGSVSALVYGDAPVGTVLFTEVLTLDSICDPNDVCASASLRKCNCQEFQVIQ